MNATTSWMSVGGEEGFRTMWVVGELLAETNYTAWIVDERGVTSAAIWFSTKEGQPGAPTHFTSLGFHGARRGSVLIRQSSFLPLPTRRPHPSLSINSLRRPPPPKYNRLQQLPYHRPPL